ncbi:leucine zipper domain-containing protein [Hirsutella rhossiliensis]|uniref:Leucine zipper domain-containing protein n=1 Tax=Hirsutella rhossiliensis TaxID=111463 RepID=A0A9P8MPN4_9HYPO|nr:leucine zipper domain-containing protein [Hirsutella rhossiliensis]KAH0958935.1 leucine zipper domain-containing protein [Hirsutella rhossiliensis]
MALQQPSPTVKLEASTEPLISTLPSEGLFRSPSPSSPAPTTMNPMDMMTPEPTADDQRLSSVPEDQSETPGPTSEKKSSKKRKSWGQVLPEPKTNLPPRKRAKTEDEKEQRRVERVLRNRRAAQSSRERKRLEVEALEIRNKELENLLLNARKANLMLVEELNRFRRDSGVVTRSSSPLDSLRDNPITLSQQLFGSQDELKPAPEHSNLGELMMSSANPTVNPASLSPELTPVPDLAPTSAPVKTEAQPGQQTTATSPDLTQRPAEMLCDLRCHTSAEDDAPFSLGDSLGLSSALGADRYVLESGLLASPISSTLDDDYLVGDSAADLSAQSAFDFFNIDDFLNDEANHAASDFVAASDDAAADHGLEPQVHDSEIQVS